MPWYDDWSFIHSTWYVVERTAYIEKNSKKERKKNNNKSQILIRLHQPLKICKDDAKLHYENYIIQFGKKVVVWQKL